MKPTEALELFHNLFHGFYPGGPKLDDLDDELFGFAVQAIAEAIQDAAIPFRLAERLAAEDSPIVVVETFLFSERKIVRRVAMRTGRPAAFLDHLYAWIQPLGPNIPQRPDGEFIDAEFRDLLDFAFEVDRLFSLGAFAFLRGDAEETSSILAGNVQPA